MDRSSEDNMIFNDKRGDDLYTTAIIIKKDSKQSDMSMNRKDKSVKDNMIFDDEISYDPYTPATTDRKDRKQTDAPADRKDKVNINMISNDNMGSDPCTPADAIERDKRHTEKAIDRENGVGDNMCNDLRTPANKFGKDGKQLDKTVDRKDNLDDNVKDSKPRTNKDTLKKGGRIPWWYKLIDDNARNNQHFPRDTIRRDDRDANLTLKADRFRQRSSGHGAQGLNKRHTTRVWDPKSKIISEGQSSSRTQGQMELKGGECSRVRNT